MSKPIRTLERKPLPSTELMKRLNSGKISQPERN